MTVDQIKAGFKQVQANLLIVVVSLAIGAVVGRFAAPTKVVTKTETKTQSVADTQAKDTDVIKKNDSEQKKNDKLYTRTETISPDGTKTIKTQILDKGTITTGDTTTNTSTNNTNSQVSSSSDTTASKTVERDKTGTLIYGIASAQVSDLLSGPKYGAGVQKRLIGPIWFGAYGTSNSTVGVTLGIGF